MDTKPAQTSTRDSGNNNGPSERSAGRQVRVCLPLPLGGGYDYLVPDELDVEPGHFVRVPLGNRRLTGIVWGPADGTVDPDRLKPVLTVHDAPPLNDVHRRFLEWVAGYTLTPLGQVARMSMSVVDALDPPQPFTGYRLPDPVAAALDDAPGDGAELQRRLSDIGPGVPGLSGTRLTAARMRVLTTVRDQPLLTAQGLAREAGCSPSVIKGLVALGLLEPMAIRPDDGPGSGSLGMAETDPAEQHRLSPDQQAAARRIVATLGRSLDGEADIRPIVLDGVTGAGKTDVYFEAVAEAVAQGRQSLVLLPEIALSRQWLDRFRQRFGDDPVVWHSDLTATQRRRAWRDAAEGRARVVIGARSALFLPMPRLGLIVVDEEHDSSFKQEEGVIYHARDMAVVRARLEGVPAVLVSATPSLETMHNVQRGKYDHVVLPSRFGGASLPEHRLVDLRSDPPPRREWLSPIVRAAVGETLERAEQVLLFLNRRGYAPLTLCRACGHRLDCPNCTAWLVEHRLVERLRCHHCGHQSPLPSKCSECGEADSFVACGPGVERVAEEARALWPDARVAIVASDLLHGPNALESALSDIADGSVDIIVGTQIMAKGHHFPRLTLVGVVDGDLGLNGGDLRAAERTYQLLQQVAGRAGRADRPGSVLIQTWSPDTPVMQALASHDRDRFLAAESQARQASGMPPFSRLVALVVTGADVEKLSDYAGRLGRARPIVEGIEVFGPATAPLAVLRGRHRLRFLVRARRAIPVQPVIAAWLERERPPSGVRVAVDVDPSSFL